MPYIGEPYDADYFKGSRPEGYTDYTGQNPLIWTNIADDIETTTGLVSGKSVLEIGFGFGHQLAELESRGAIVEGVDISAYAVGQAQSLFPTLSFQIADVTTGLPFSNNSFDLVIAIQLTDCMPDQANFLATMLEINRVMKPDGAGGKGYILNSDKSDHGYFLKSSTSWQAETLSGRTITPSDVGHMLPVDVRVVID
jgi:SAM-dependent methyltransferase